MQLVLMVALIMGLVLSAIVAMYVVGELLTRLHYRRRYGIDWPDVLREAEVGRGCFIVDYALGRSRGLSDVVVWWCPNRLSGPSDPISAILDEGRLTACPDELKDPERLRATFPAMQVLTNDAVRLYGPKWKRRTASRARH